MHNLELILKMVNSKAPVRIHYDSSGLHKHNTPSYTFKYTYLHIFSYVHICIYLDKVKIKQYISEPYFRFLAISPSYPFTRRSCDIRLAKSPSVKTLRKANSTVLVQSSCCHQPF